MAWEADYPHSDSMWPTAPEELHAVFVANAVPDDDIDKMTHENAMRWYSFDPFAHMAKEESTVGALRRRAAGHDVSVMSRSTRVAHAGREARGLPQAGPPGHGGRAALTPRPCPTDGYGGDGSSPLRRVGPHPVAQGGAGVEHVGLGDRAGRGRVAPADGVEEGGVIGAAAPLLFREEGRRSWPGTTRTAWRR